MPARPRTDNRPEKDMHKLLYLQITTFESAGGMSESESDASPSHKTNNFK